MGILSSQHNLAELAKTILNNRNRGGGVRFAQVGRATVVSDNRPVAVNPASKSPVGWPFFQLVQ